MKFSALILTIGFCTLSFLGYGQSKTDNKEKPRTMQESQESNEMEVVEEAQSEVAKVSIPQNQLPDEVFIEIRDNYYNGDIISSYKLMDDGKLSGYLVEVTNGPMKWTLEFDETGNALNKIEPNK